MASSFSEGEMNPYQFDPLRLPDHSSDDSNSDDSCQTILNNSDDNLNVDLDQNEFADNSWCKCGNCGIPAKKEEKKCCYDESTISKKMSIHNIGCITNHPDFYSVCLNLAVLEVAFYQYSEENATNHKDVDIHRKYRYVAYRQFARWIFHRLGRKRRVILPACVVKQIRDKFPSELYTGFKYPRL
ncbi:P2X purinoceptor 7-like [Biomphalaria glabrata]|uniref:P2X purinoceptor 7-like n=1 Tax=Biomphalaria glabrata TaxID=6526 RepID=A0A9W2YKN8_BIOGL|nr:P2X purinoceptor 7-like [Biomphalaria glabrata]